MGRAAPFVPSCRNYRSCIPTNH